MEFSSEEDDFLETIKDGVCRQFQPDKDDYILPKINRVTRMFGIPRKYVPKNTWSTLYRLICHTIAFIFHIILSMANIWDNTMCFIHKLIYFSDRFSNWLLRDRQHPEI